MVSLAHRSSHRNGTSIGSAALAEIDVSNKDRVQWVTFTVTAAGLGKKLAHFAQLFSVWGI